MSVNQLTPEKNTFIYRKSGSGRSNLSSGHLLHHLSVGTGSVSGPLSEPHSFKKSNNAQGGQSRGNFGSVNTPSSLNSSVGAHALDNGGHAQPTLHGVSQTGARTAAPKVADTSSQKIQYNSKAPPSHPSSMTSDNTTLPSTPAKGDPGKGFPLQFGSLSPGIMNGTVVPRQNTSPPPNLDEQKHKQAQIDALKATSSAPVPPAPKQQHVACYEQPVIKETHTKAKRDSPVTSAPPLMQVQSQRPLVLHAAGMSMPMPFHQPNVPIKFGGPNPQIQSQSMGNNSLQVPMQMPLPMGNVSQVQQPVYMPGLQHHLMQTQGIMHPGHGLGLSPPLGHPLPHQMGNVGLNMSPQFNQQQSGKFANARKTVKITHPETHEELRLDKGDGGSPGSRSKHIRPQQSQPVPSYTSAHPVGYYSNSYASGPPHFPTPNSLPLANTQLTSSPQSPRYNYPISISTIPLTKHSSPSKGGVATHEMLEPLPSEFARDAQNVLSLPPSLPIPLTVNAAGGSPRERVTDFSDAAKVELQKLPRTVLQPVVPKDLEVTADGLSPQSKPGLEHSRQPALGSVTSVTTSMNVVQKDTPIKSDSAVEMGKQTENKGDSAKQDSGDSSKATSAQDGSASTPSGVEHLAPVSVKDSAIITNAASSGIVNVGSGTTVKAGKDVHAKQNDLMQGVAKETRVAKEQGEKETIGGLQSDGSLKAMDFVKKGGQDGDKNFVQKADLLEVSQKEVGSITSLHTGDKTVSQISPLACGSATLDSSNMSTSTIVSMEKDSVSCKEYDASRSSVLDNRVAPASSNLSEMNLGQDGEGMENLRLNPSLGSNKTSMEPGNTKNNKSKKKRKEMLQKADAQGTSSDLYMAYKGPEEKKEVGASMEVLSDSNLKNFSVEARPVNSPRKKNYEKNKPEFEDWENAAADISVTDECGGSYNDDKGVTNRKYSRDFLLTFSEQYTDLPEGFEVTFDIADAFMHTNVSTMQGYREHTNTGKITDRPSAAMRIDRRGNGVMDGDRWAKLPGGHTLVRNPGLELAYGGKIMGFRPGPAPNFGVRGQGPVQYLGGILSEPMYSIGLQRNKPDDRWQRAANFNRGLMSSSQAPLQAMHKAEIKYEVGRVTDEEQAKQRRLKAILNKLTPQNFEKLFEQVKEVNIDNAVTLTGVISQIFDKALMEPTFCEMYANFCYHLASELPDLSVDNEKITFKRLLLNKCQEEFERGEREEEEANKVDGEGELSEVEREEKRLKARRRMLGNIRLIGELYKKRMLTERIMHECIKKLLGQYHNPDEENIEALCKLMSTIGEMIDHPKAKEHMDAYFDIMGQLSNNMRLSSRVRFMLRDSIDLRKNKWQQRRKVEGPKKIEEVHRDVAKERQGQAGRLSRGPNLSSAMRRGQPIEYGPRGSILPVGQAGCFKGLPTQARGYGGKDVRMDDRSILENGTVSVPLLQKTSGDVSITLGPQGGLARGMSFKGQASVSGAPSADSSSFYGDPRKMVGGSNGYRPVSDHAAYSSREDGFRRATLEKFGVSTVYVQSSGQHLNSNYTNKVSKDAMHRSMPPLSQEGVSSAQSHPSEKVWPEERLRDMSIAAIKEYYSAKDEKEVALCIKDLNALSFYPTVVSIWITDAFERKDKERDMLAQLLVGLAKLQEGIFSQDQLIEGFESVLTNLEDTVTDAPRAPEFLGRIFGKVISENVLPFKDVGQLIHEGGEEPGRLLEVGLAADVLGGILEMIKLEKGESMLNEIRSSSNLRLEDFRPPDPIRSKKLEMFIM